MEKELIKSFEYGAAKNGATISILPELNCIHLEWKGDVLLEEWIEILSTAIEEIKTRKVIGWIADTTNLGATTEEHNNWIQEFWMPGAMEAGLKKLVVVLPNDVLGEMTMTEIMDNVKDKSSEADMDLKSMYTKDYNEAIEWIKSV